MLFKKKEPVKNEQIEELESQIVKLKSSISTYKTELVELEEGRFERKIYRSLAAVLAISDTKDTLVSNITKSIADGFNATYCGIFEINHKQKMLKYVGGYGYRPGLIPGIPIIGCVMGEAIHRNEVVSENNIKDRPDAVCLNQDPTEYDVFCFPLKLFDDDYGILRIANIKNENRAEVTKILMNIVPLISATLERQISNEKSRRLLKGVETGFAIARQLENTLKEVDILSYLLKSIPNLFQVKCAVLALGNINGFKSIKRLSPEAKTFAGGSKQSELLYLRNLLGANPSGRVLIEDIHFNKKYALAGIRSVLMVPILVNKKMYGIIACFSPADVKYSKSESNLLGLAAVQTSLTLERASYFRQQEELASVDGLTGLYNHRMFQETIRSEIARSLRYKCPLTMLMFDIDFFKKFNDKYGHPVGDEVLRMVATVIKSLIRTTDKAFRYGGEEFCILLTETNIKNSMIFAERLRKSIQENRAIQGLSVTISIGLAEYKESEKAQEVINRADKAMYKSKEGGRNMVSL